MAQMSKTREALAQMFIAALKEDQIPWAAGWNDRPMNGATGKPYRGINRAYLSQLAVERGYEDTRWCTYKQAQDNGWQVRKGEKGTQVEYWAFFDQEKKKLLDWPEARRLEREDQEYFQKNLTLRCRTSKVFNAEQMDGVPPMARLQADIGQLRAQRDTLIQNMGVGYREGGSQAYYVRGTDTVVLPPESSFKDTYSYFSTLLHECGHASGHESRLNRPPSGSRGTPDYAREELRAEIGSAFTAQALGLQLTEKQMQQHWDMHKAYIQSWAKALEDNPEELFAAIRDAEKISDYLIEQGEFPEPEEHRMEAGFDRDQIQEIRKGLQDGLAREQLALYTKPEFNYGQMREIREGLQYGLTMRQVSLYAKPEFDSSQMLFIRLGLENGLTMEQLALYAQPNVDSSEMYEIKVGFEGGLSMEQIAFFARPEFDWSQMREIRMGFQNGLAMEQLALYAKPEFNFAQMQEIRKGCQGGLTMEQLALYTRPEFNSAQMQEIREGCQGGLTMRQVSLYAKPEFDSVQMWQIREGYQNGLTMEQISLYAKPEFNSAQMGEIRIGYQDGLTMEQISLYSKPEFDWSQMREIRKTGDCVMDGQLVTDLAAEPTVTILWSECPQFKDGQVMGLSKANIRFAVLDAEMVEHPGYYKTEFRIDYVIDGKPGYYEGRQDLGDGDGTLINHIKLFQTEFLHHEEWDDALLRTKGPEALAADHAKREAVLNRLVPYLEQHDYLSYMEGAAKGTLQNRNNPTPAESAYYTAMQTYVSECRGMLNNGELELPPAPRLIDFDPELQAYREHVKEEISIEAKAAGMTVEEYAANGWQPYAGEQPESAPDPEPAPEPEWEMEM